MHQPLQLGLIGTARITPMSVIRPAKKLSGLVEVAAVASRSGDRARRFAAKHNIARAYGSYEALLGDTGIDALYIALPPGLHAHWSKLALAAGKHVLCEKPMAMNASQAHDVGEAARQAGRVVAEAMHFRYHPLAARIRQIAGSDLGPVERLEVRISFPVFRSSNSRYHYELGGGALMDQGCYAVSLIRLVAGGELKVTAAEARLASPKVDRWMRAELKLPGGGAAHLICSIWSAEVFRCSLYVKGLNGEMRVSNPVAPHLFHRLKWKASGAGQREQIKNCQSTYYYQLKAFAEAASGMSTLATGADEAEANLRVIDAIYRRAGLPIRGETQ